MPKSRHGELPVPYRPLVALAVSGAGWILSAPAIAAGVAFLVSFPTYFMTLGPLDRIRAWTDPVTLPVAFSLGLAHPVLVAATALVLGLGLLLVQQLIRIGARALEVRIVAPKRTTIVTEKSATDYGPGRLSEDEVRRIKERMLKSYGEEAHPDVAQFVVSAPDSERRREELLKQFWKIEQALKASSRKRCTFLSADVVGSTAMKQGQDEAAVKATFHAYESMLKKIFADHGAWKEAWTPDGVMVCFLDRDLAAAAARCLLANLPRFNKMFNKLPVPFQVRCGINEGELSIYEDSPLERVADRVIDVAGHMQKHAPPDVLLVPVHVHEALADRSGFEAYPLVVDGFSTWAWHPKG